MGAVEQLHKTEPEAVVRERVAVELQGDLGGGRVIGLKTTFPQDADPASMNDVLDRLYDAVERQKAKPEIVQLGKTVATNKKIIGDNNAILEVAERDHQKQVGLINAAIELAQKEIAQRINSAKDLWNASGKRGEYVEDARVKAERRKSDDAIASLVKQRDKFDEDRAKAIRDTGIATAKAEREIAECEKLIEERRRLIEGRAE